jgi:hypothetical protein
MWIYVFIMKCGLAYKELQFFNFLNMHSEDFFIDILVK